MSGKPKVLVARAIFPEHLALLEPHCELDYNAGDEPLTKAELAARLVDKRAALITGSERIDAGVLAQAGELSAICSISVGYNHIDIAACTGAGVLVTNTPEVLTETTADMGFALLMAAARRISESERWLREGHWKRWALDQFLGTDVHGSTLGIVGMGRIGRAIARRARGFAMNVVYHNRARLAPELEAQSAAQYLDLDSLLRVSDHVILVLPYSVENHHLIGASQLALMKPYATLSNIARGGLIDERALCAALREGRIAAAALDVFEGEPQVLEELLALRNVVLTPHLGSASRATRDAMARLAIANLVAVLAGDKPPCLVNPQAWGH